MKSLEGFRTILVAVLSIVGIVAAKYGFDFPVEDQTELVGYIMGISMIAMRLITKKPAGKLNNPNVLKTSVLSVCLAIMLVMVSGCESFGKVKPETLRQGIAAAYMTTNAMADGVRIAKRDGYIDDEQRDQLLDELQESMDSIGLAQHAMREFERGNGSDYTVFQHLTQAETILGLVAAKLEANRP